MNETPDENDEPEEEDNDTEEAAERAPLKPHDGRYRHNKGFNRQFKEPGDATQT